MNYHVLYFNKVTSPLAKINMEMKNTEIPK